MELKNKIITYFVAMPPKGEVPRVFKSPVTIGEKTARELISKWLKQNNKPPLLPGPLLRVCFDLDSKMVYAPNAHDFSPDKYEMLLKAAQVRITKDFGGFSHHPVITSSPFSSLRIRSINSFKYAKDVIKKHYGEKRFKDIPVIEANLKRMPSTIKMLPPIFRNEQFMGGYISPSFRASVDFIDEIDDNNKKREKPIHILTQQTPFILINLASGGVDENNRIKEISATDKESVVLIGYRDYLYDGENIKETDKNNLAQYADLYAIKRYMYLGWPFEQICTVFLSRANNYGSLMKGISLLMSAAISLENEGYKNPARTYYITFKIDRDFPFKFIQYMKEDGTMDIGSQFRYFRFLNYDTSNSYILIESSVYLTPDICYNILKAKSTPFISTYNPMTNTIDIKGSETSYSEMKSNKLQLNKIKAIILSKIDDSKKDSLTFKSDPSTHGIDAVNPNVFSVRDISEYYHASDIIKEICEEYGVPFESFQVVVGPIQRILGRGTHGGYMDKKMFLANKMSIPFKIAEGIFIRPPVMFIDSEEYPNYADHTGVIIHEYTHHLFSIKNPNYSPQYNKKRSLLDEEYWYNYFNDPSEREAHKRQIKYELKLGKSYDEIIRDKVGNYITLENHPIAIKFSELVMEAMKELEMEEEINEEPTTESK